MPSNKELLSNTITFLRFPLIVAIVFIHINLHGFLTHGISTVSSNIFPIYNTVFHLLSKEIAGVAVPIFFFISGFLFYYGPTFSWQLYKEKLKKRKKTLLIPYLFWNTLVFFLLYIKQLGGASITSGEHKLIRDYGVTDFLSIYWNMYDGKTPACMQFWFIRDLMVVVLFSMILYYWIKYLKGWGVILLGLWWFLDSGTLTLNGLGNTAFFFFALGAWFSIKQRNFVTQLLPFLVPSVILYGILCSLSTLFWYYGIEYQSYIHKLGILCGISVLFSLTAKGLKKKKLQTNTFLAGSSFFIFAYHNLVVVLLTKTYIRVVHPNSEIALLSGYLLIPLITVLLGLGIFFVLKRFLPTFTGWITGDR